MVPLVGNSKMKTELFAGTAENAGVLHTAVTILRLRPISREGPQGNPQRLHARHPSG
mgnify:CR=1 FL=1